LQIFANVNICLLYSRVGNVFAITGCMNCSLSLAGCKLILS